MDNNRSLEERVHDLENKVHILEDRIHRLSEQRGGRSQTAPFTKADPVLAVPTTSKAEPIEWDVLIFQKILPRLFILVFIIGILWGFKAASDFGILTDKVKVALGYAVSGLFILFGIIQIRRSRTLLGQVLLGGVIPILMLSTFAMHQLYGLTGPTISFILNVLWIGLGIFFTHQYKSQGIGIVSAVGGVFVPFLIKSATPNIPVFVFYETILYVLFIWLALRYRYNILYYISAVFLNIALVIFFIFAGVPDEYKWLAVSPILVQQIALLTGFFKSSFDLKQQAYTLFASVILSSLWVGSVLTDREASIVFAFITLLYAACYYFYKSDRDRAPILIANALIGALFFAENIDTHLTIEVLIGSSVVYMYVSKKYKSVFHGSLSGITYLSGLILTFELLIPSWISWEMLHWIVLLAATGYAIRFLTASRTKNHQLILNIGIPYFSILLLVFTSLLSTLLAGGAGENTERTVMSILWIAIAVLFMVLSKPLSIQQGKYVGAGILFLTLAKIIAVDIHFVSVAVRALMFILLGIVGLIVSRVYYKK